MIDTNSKNIFCFLGLPASGKGTQVELLSKKIGAQVLSMGNLIREEVENADLSDPFYSNIQERYIKGIPQEDEVIIDIIKKHLERHADKDIIFDNFPFSKFQAEKLFDMCKRTNSNPFLFIINISPKTALNRIVHRKICSACGAIFIDSEASICEECGGSLVTRSDDNTETVEKRIKFYLPRIAEVKDIFIKYNSVYEIDGEQSIDSVQESINKVLNDIK